MACICCWLRFRIFILSLTRAGDKLGHVHCSHQRSQPTAGVRRGQALSMPLGGSIKAASCSEIPELADVTNQHSTADE